MALIGGVLTLLMANPLSANAACAVTAAGTVNCDADTMTHQGTNLNGINTATSDRTQAFDNGSAIVGTIGPSATVSGFGLELAQDGAIPLPLTMSNQGRVFTEKGINALKLDGNGGPIRYFGDGSIASTTNSEAALFVDNTGGSVGIRSGTGAISGATGMDARTTGAGAVTIATGSGLVTGTAGPAISASTAGGPLSITVGSGGVTGTSKHHAIGLTSTNGDISVTANGTVTGIARCTSVACAMGGVNAISNGAGNITVDGSGAYSAIGGGRAIFAQQNSTGLGGILVTGAGTTLTGNPSFGISSAIRAQITNPADASNIVVDRSGDITAIDTFPVGADLSVSADIHALTLGAGNVTVAGGAGATLSNAGVFGIEVSAAGKRSTGNISVSTAAGSALTANGSGIFADNGATAISASAGSTITVTANGTINSGALLNPVGRDPGEGGGSVATPAGISAGYNGGPVFSTSSTGPYTSCGPFGCTTLTPNPKVSGTVSVVNNAAINAAGGNGIFAFNFGNGNVSVRSNAPISVTGATAQNGIAAFSAELGNISVVTNASVFAGNGSGIQTTSTRSGSTTIDVLAGTTQGAASGVAATSTRGPIQIDNAAAIQNSSGLASDPAVVTSGGGNASFTNNAGAVVTGTVAMTGDKTGSFINAGVWNTSAASMFAGVGSIDNTGTINVLGPTSFGGLTTLSNGGILNLAPSTGAVGTLTIAGSLALRSGALYVVALAPTTSSAVDVGGKTSLAGAVQAVLVPAAFSKETYTILHSAGGFGGTTFSGFTNPGFTGSLTYTPTDVLLSLTASLGTGGGLNANQRNVATAINNIFNSGGTLPPSFAPIFRSYRWQSCQCIDAD